MIAQVTMLSVFLRRKTAGSNRHVERAIADVNALPPITRNKASPAATAHQFRSGQATEHLGFRLNEVAQLGTFAYRPCPQNDFNGADFLYFASFQSIADRAQWHWGPDVDSRAPTRHREIFYYGNLDVGEGIRVLLCGKFSIRCPLRGHSEVRYWYQIVRDGDGKLIADVFTVKELP